MDSNFGELKLFSNELIKDGIVDPQEGQMRLAAGRDDNWPVKEESDGTFAIKEDMEDEEIWKFEGCSTKMKSDFGQNPEPKRKKFTPPTEDNSYVIQQGLNSEVKEEAEPFAAFDGPFVPPTSGQAGGILTFMKHLPDNQEFNAHDLFSNEAMVKDELEEFISREAVSGNKAETGDDDVGQMADGYDTEEKQEDVWKECPVDGCPQTCSEEDLAKHTRTHPLPLTCRICKTKCSTAYHLREHYLTHSGAKPFHCAFCERKFSRGDALKKHMNQHTDELPFGCDKCDRRFESYSDLHYHRQIHDERKVEKAFNCSECGLCFSQKKNMERHKTAIHAGIKKYSCPECDFQTAYGSGFRGHMRRKHGN